jgi:hypothetical protein
LQAPGDAFDEPALLPAWVTSPKRVQ